MAIATHFSLTDGGIETALTERLGQELPEFAAFVLLDTEEGRQALRDYFVPFIELADRTGSPLVLDTPTWRANPDWVKLLGYPEEEVGRINADAVRFLRDHVADSSRSGTATSGTVTVNGCVGPRFDDYVAEQRMTAAEAEAYHGPQVAALAEAGADRVTSVTTLDEAEAIGVVNAARAAGVPVAVSFTVGADGLLPNGSTIADAIATVDDATDGAPIGFLVNCAHPEEVGRALKQGTGGGDASDDAAHPLGRLIGFRLNAAHEGDDGPGDAPEEFARGLLELRSLAPRAEIFGGCCGTDVPHITEIAKQRA